MTSVEIYRLLNNKVLLNKFVALNVIIIFVNVNERLLEKQDKPP